MTQVIASLNWGPVGSLLSTLSAPITLNFGQDQNWMVAFNSGFQGDAVEPVSLKVDNSGNNTPITYQKAQGQDTIPAYSVGYIDIRTLYGLTFTCVNPVSVNMEVQNFPAQYGFAPASANPNLLTNDPYFSNVVGLYHFFGVNPLTSFQDSSIAGFGTVAGGATAETGTVRIKPNSASIAGPAMQGQSTNQVTLKEMDFTLEFSLNVASVGTTLGNTYQLFSVGTYLTVTAFIGGAAPNIHLTLAYCGHSETITANFDTWNDYAFSFVGNSLVILVNGVVVRTTNNIVFGTGPVAANLQFSLNTNPISIFAYIAELRFTNKARYNNSYNVTLPFLNQ